jgi:hypothetical protein
MNGNAGKLTMARFESLLEAYGGNLARWPAQDARPAAALLEGSAEARSRLAEARALDHVLDRASAPDPKRLRVLADRIVAEAANVAARPDTSSQRPLAERDGAGARIIPLPRPRIASRPAGEATGQPPRRTARHPQPQGWRWQPAAALAASLLIGIAIGLTDTAQTTTLGLASLTGAPASDTEVVLSALSNDSLNVLDEDQI